AVGGGVDRGLTRGRAYGRGDGVLCHRAAAADRAAGRRPRPAVAGSAPADPARTERTTPGGRHGRAATRYRGRRRGGAAGAASVTPGGGALSRPRGCAGHTEHPAARPLRRGCHGGYLRDRWNGRGG